MPDFPIEQALQKGKLVKHDEEISYYRLKEGMGKIPRGTVVLGKRIIYGFPHIKRIFTLEKGIAKNIKGGREEIIYAEEKIDGYNLRVASVAGKIYAFSRGGFVDYFATEKAREIISKKFFSGFPSHVLCCEMAGNTPYTKPSEKYDVMIYAFEIDDGNGNYLDCGTKYKILDKYGIKSVPRLARLHKGDVKKLREIALALNKGKKEGMVLKSASGDRVKYVTPYADIEDIANNAFLMFDMPTGFFMQRVLRSAIFIKDFSLGHGSYSRELGEAFYSGLMAKLNGLDKGGRVSEEFVITIRDAKIWEWIKKHMSREVKIETLYENVGGNGRTIRFRKIYKKSDQKLRSYLNGKGIID